MSCELDEKPDGPMRCARDQHGCVTEGQPLHWPSPCIPYAVQLDGSPKSNLDADQVQALAVEAFAAWQAAPCGGGGTPSFQAQFQGYVTCDQAESVCADASKNVNVIMFHDRAWPYQSSKLGVTTPSGGVVSGLMNDADVELNSQDFMFTTGTAGLDETALKFVLTHELGHFLGLAHSDVDGALMSPGYQSVMSGSSLLSADDVAAICTAYPPTQPLSCPTPSAPVYDTCQVDLDVPRECKLKTMSQGVSRSGCSCRAAPRGRPLPALSALGTLLAWLAWRRRARQHLAPSTAPDR